MITRLQQIGFAFGAGIGTQVGFQDIAGLGYIVRGGRHEADDAA